MIKVSITAIAATVPGPLILLNQLQAQLNSRIQIESDIISNQQITDALDNNRYAVIFSDQEIFTDEVESQYIGEEQLQVNLDQFAYLANQPTITFDELKGMSFIVMRAIGPWSTIIQDKVSDAKFMYQDDRDAFAEITKYSRFPFFTTNLSKVTHSLMTRFKRIRIVSPYQSVTKVRAWSYTPTI